MQYIPGTGSKFTDTAIWNTGGLVVHYKPTTQVDLAAGYSYTRATTSNIINATATVGDGYQSAPSSSRSQFAGGVGIITRFHAVAYRRLRRCATASIFEVLT